MNQGYGYGPQVPQQGYPPGYPPRGAPPPKKGGAGKVVLILLTVLFGSCVAIGAIGGKGGKGTASTSGAELPAASNAFPWLAQVKQNCDAYDAAPNDIKKSAIFRANEGLLGRVSVQNARGKLAMLRTNQGGSELSLAVKADGAEFKTESMFAPIRQGTPIYDVASELKVGDCVVFSVKKIETASLIERSKVCSADYFADFASLAPCR